MGVERTLLKSVWMHRLMLICYGAQHARVVIRGSFGNFVIAMNSKFEHVHDAISTEAHTMKE
jgi:hypothetical protein